MEWKINMNNSEVITLNDGKSSARIVLDKDGVHGQFTDIHCSLDDLGRILKYLDAIGIQFGPAKESHNPFDSIGAIGLPIDLISSIIGDMHRR